MMRLSISFLMFPLAEAPVNGLRMADDLNTTSKSEVAPNAIKAVMAKYPEIICFTLAVLCTILTNYVHSATNKRPPIFKEQPPPKHFFRSKSIVLDFPFGNLNNVGSLLEREEILFVMFYAPWCASSQKLRSEFETAALYLKGKVSFVGINCWYNKGQCRLKNNFQEFPVFYLYFMQRDGYRFHGIPTAANLVRFVESMMYPLTRLTSQNQLVLFLSQNDNAVVGYFDFNTGPQPPGFQQFYFAAMRSYETDPWNRIQFGVITDLQLAKDFHMNSSQTVYYCRALNDTLKFPQSKNFTMSALSGWALSLRTESTVQWLRPTGAKSLRLSDELEKGPALIAFVPDAPMLPINQYYAMMRELVLGYRSCDGDVKWTEMVQTSQYARWTSLLRHFNKLQQCLPQLNDPDLNIEEEEAESEASTRLPHTQCCLTMTFPNRSSLGPCDACVNFDALSALAGKPCGVLSAVNILQTYGGSPVEASTAIEGSLPSSGCSVVHTTYNPTEFLSFCCQGRTRYGHLSPGPLPPTMSDRRHGLHFENTTPHITPQHHMTSDDPYITNHIGDNMLQRQCRQLRFQREHQWLPPIDIVDFGFTSEPLSANISQLGCDSNRTLNLYVMNVAESSSFLHAVTGKGANSCSNASSNATFLQSSVVLLDLENDFQHRMSVPFSKQNLARLMLNFSEQSLDRHLRSGATESQHRQCDINQNSNDTKNQAVPCKDSLVDIVEVTSSSFQRIVMDPHQDVVLLYYTPCCGFCQSFTHIFLSLSNYFSHASNITFARINADDNDLPWQFTVDVYPTIVMYPAHNKAESRMFPDHLQKTLPNLILFVLRHSAHALKLETSLEVCSSACVAANVAAASRRIRELQVQSSGLEKRVAALEARLSPVRASAVRGGPHGDVKADDRGPSLSSSTDTVYDHSIYVSDKERPLIERLDLLRLLLSRRRQQEKSTRQLYAILRAGGPLDRHRVDVLLQQYSLHQAHYRTLVDKLTQIMQLNSKDDLV